jgi:hypothetical protein
MRTAQRTAEQFKLDSATDRFLRESAKLTEGHAAALQQLQAMNKMFGPSDDVLRAIKTVRLDYSAQFADIRSAFDSFARMASVGKLDRLAEFRAPHESWLKQAGETSALIHDFVHRSSAMIDLTKASLARLEPFQLGVGLGLERYSHFLDVSMKTLADSAASIYDTDRQTLTSLPRLVVERPLQELFVHVTGVEVITSIEADEGQAEAEALEADTEATLLPLLERLDPVFVQKWKGARQALASRNPDRIAHVSVSIRELFRLVLHHVAPEEEIRAWSKSKDDFDKGRPTRAARFRFATRSVGRPPFAGFLAKDFSAAQELLTLFDRGVHESRPSLTERQVRLMTLRMDQFLRFLLEIARESDS